MANLCFLLCDTIKNSPKSTTFTSNFVFKHQGQLNCWIEPSITYKKRITYFSPPNFDLQTVPNRLRSQRIHRKTKNFKKKLTKIRPKQCEKNCRREPPNEIFSFLQFLPHKPIHNIPCNNQFPIHPPRFPVFL